MKITIYVQKNLLNSINGNLDITVGKVNAPEDMCCTNHPKETEKNQVKMKTALVIWGRFSMDQIYVIDIQQEKRVRGDNKYLKI